MSAVGARLVSRGQQPPTWGGTLTAETWSGDPAYSPSRKVDQALGSSTRDPGSKPSEDMS